MAFGTLSTCLPTYRPILHHLLGHKSSSGKLERKCTQIHGLISGKSRSTQKPFKTDARSVLPFTRLENTSELLRHSISPTPLRTIKNATTAERANSAVRTGRSMGLTEINVMTDLEQISLPDPAVLFR